MFKIFSMRRTSVLAACLCTASVASASDLIGIEDLQYLGAFVLPTENFGLSSANWSTGVIHVEGDQFFIAGHNHDDHVAAFTLPALTISEQVTDLAVATQIRQPFAPIFDAKINNPDNHDYITGLYKYNNALVVNSLEYYDGPGDNKTTTTVIKDASALKTSEVVGMHSLQGAARAAGWITEIPPEWQSQLKGTHISGNSSGLPIITRLSVGPSAFVFDMDSLVAASEPSSIKTEEVLGFSLKKPLHSDLLNENGDNFLWNHLSRVAYGFIVPGTATYMTIGVSAGHNSGLGYKLKRNDGSACSGFCPGSVSDVQHYYWLWDVRDMVKVRQGKLKPYDIKPYAFGPFTLPTNFSSNQAGGKRSNKHHNAIRIGGASYDNESNILYVSLINKLLAKGGAENPPIIMGLQINTQQQ